jgi:hypothetical protein
VSGYERMREVLAESNELATVFGAETRFGRAVAAIRQVFADIRATSDADSVDDVAAVEIIDDLDEARNQMSSVEFDDELYARTRDLILDAVAQNQNLRVILAHRTARLERLTAASTCGCSCHSMPGVMHIAPCCNQPPARDAGTCECGEPVEQVLGNDGIWRWAHTARGIVRDHVAKPVG